MTRTKLAQGLWPRIAHWGLWATGVGMALLAFAFGRQAADAPFWSALQLLEIGLAIAILTAGVCAMLRIREDIAATVPTTIAAALFALILVSIRQEDNLEAISVRLGVPAMLAAAAISVRLFRDGFVDRPRGPA